MPKKQLKGIVTSDKMEKTIVVSVELIKEHKKYKRRYKINKKYKAHDEKGQFRVGDVVTIEECRPISKHKRWRVLGEKLVQNEEQELKDKEQEIESN